jgi:hypothetical protein
MTSMGNLGNYGPNVGMGGVGGAQAGPNVGVAGLGQGPNAYAPAYANVGYANPAPFAPACVVGVAPIWNTTGMILVLFILLVLITRCVI